MTDKTRTHNTFETELASVKGELHAYIRAQAGAMTPDERARYVARLPKVERAMFKQITAGTPARDVERERICRQMDEAMGLAKPGPAVRREGRHCLILGATPPTPSAGRGTLSRNPPAPVRAPTRGATLPSSGGGAAAADMDRRMGLATQQHLGHRRERNALVLGTVD